VLFSAFTNTKGGRSPYRRIGKSTLRMSKDEYGRGVLHTPFPQRLILEKDKDKLYFDSQICKEATFVFELVDKNILLKQNIFDFKLLPFLPLWDQSNMG
jgi:hypothetical protein